MDKIKAFSILTLILIVLTGIISIYTLNRINYLNKINEDTDSMITLTNDIHSLVLENEIAILSFATTYDSVFLDSIQNIQTNIYKKIDSLKLVAVNINESQEDIDALTYLIDERIATYKNSLSSNPDPEEYFEYVKAHRKENFLKFGQKIKDKNNLILHHQRTSLDEKSQKLVNNLNVLAIIIFAVVAISICAVIISFNSFSKYKKEQEAANKQLASYKEQLEEQVYQLNISNKELEQFAYVASHDLQEPLRKITSFNDLLQEQYKDELEGDGKLYLERIAFAANRMRKLITDLLEYSRAGRQKEDDEILLLENVVNEVLDDLFVVVNEKNAVINIENLPEIKGSYTDWRTVFQNLISNAIKFSKPDQNPKIIIKSDIPSEDFIKLHLEDFDAEVTYYHITVEDNGIGFNQEYADKIFIIFQRLYGKDAYDGTGIGLAVCKKIFEKMEGIIFAESEEGKGSKFHMIFPDYRS
ncbi:sensor histidine kinase [Arthrospiribacter ruber]|uniref:histidine kinase n=1 Tax=Arthrospiribacter ruber TaxID=2487934 RepID=A0A951MEN0_9BACT|nr:ATP-binding protein [Arthrospiribacter ruber]MBW3468535.1 hypothetical protein [Arthrospiribacter ruber]